MAGDASLRATWERYHLIGHAIRGEHFDPAYRVIADRVRDSLTIEPTRITPRRRRARSSYPAIAGVALAASMAFVAFFVAPDLLRDSVTRPTAAANGPPLASHESWPDQVGERWHLDRPDLASKLDRFLVTHQETVPMAGANGMLHYATFVDYEIPR